VVDRTTVEAIGLPPEQAIAYLRQKTNVTSERWTDVFGAANTRAFTVAGATTQALVGDFRREVAKALEQGTSIADFRKQFDALVEKHGWAHTGTPGRRAEIIYETNLSTAYSAGRYAQMVEPATLAAFPWWQYVHSGSLHPRKQHLAWNGLVLRADNPWWSTHYPPNGWRCRCRVRPLSDRGLQRLGRTGGDTAPTLNARPFRNPSNGETWWVPEGIDPGFGHNPGEEWLGRRSLQGLGPSRPPLRAEAVTPTAPLAVPDLPPARRSRPSGARAAEVPDTGPVPFRMPADGPAGAPARGLPEVPLQTEAEARAKLTARLRELGAPIGEDEATVDLERLRYRMNAAERAARAARRQAGSARSPTGPGPDTGPVPVPITEPGSAVPELALPSVVPRRFRSLDDADRQLTRAFRPWAAGLSEEEREALRLYKDKGFRQMNNALRKGRASPLDEEVGLLRGALARATLPDSLEVSRGMGVAELRRYLGQPAGTVLRHPGFLSTSIRPAVAEAFGVDRARILLPEGMRGAAYVHPFPEVQLTQYEVLIRPDLALRIVSSEAGEVVLEALPDE
jgi:hypothetical protein